MSYGEEAERCHVVQPRTPTEKGNGPNHRVYTAYYDSLTDEEVAENRVWGEFALTPFPAETSGDDYSPPLHDRAMNRYALRAVASRQRLYSFSNCLAITSLCISLVPSPMVHSFTSR
jgi:hypothetical protein